MADARTLVQSYDIQHYLSFDDGTTFIPITELNSFDASRDAEEYSTSYIDKKNQTTYRLSTSDSFDFECDALGPDGIQAKLAEHEDAVNVPCVYVRAMAWDFSTGEAAPATARVAKRATAVMNENPISQSSGNPARFSGSISITGEYEAGTFNETTKAFTAADSDGDGTE